MSDVFLTCHLLFDRRTDVNGVNPGFRLLFLQFDHFSK